MPEGKKWSVNLLVCAGLVVAVALGALAVKCQPSRSAVRWVEARGGSVHAVSADPPWLVRLVGPVGLTGLNIISVSLAGSSLGDDAIVRLQPYASTIEEIDLSGTLVSDDACERLCDWGALEVLIAAHTRLSDIGLHRLSRGGLAMHIQHLNLAGTKVTDEGVLCLSEWSHLSTLVLDETGVSDDCTKGLMKLRSIKALSLKDTGLNRRGLARICKMSGIVLLELDGTRIAGRDLALLDGMRDLNVLSINRTGVGDDAISALSTMIWLRELSIHKTTFSEAGKKRLRASMSMCKIEE